MIPAYWLAIIAMYVIFMGGVKIRDRKLERREAELRHQSWIEHLHLLHEERMALIESLDMKQLEERIDEVDETIRQLEEKALDD